MSSFTILLSVACLAAIYYGITLVQAHESYFRSVMKTVPVLLLAVAGFVGDLSQWVIQALLLCALGDWFLSREGESNFLRGLAAFLFGHLFYISFFLSVSDPDAFLTPDIGFLAIILLALSASVVWRIWPHLGDMKWPVIIYSMVISLMALTAKAAGMTQGVLAGVALFIISDIVLAQDKFTPLDNTLVRRSMPWIVWFFYFGGQALIVSGLYIGGGRL